MKVQSLGTVLSIDKFWSWLDEHHNCIVRAGAGNVWLYDYDDLHWHLSDDRDGKSVVQLVRGKHTLAEMIVDRSEVVYVEMAPSVESEGNFEFELLGGPEDGMYPLGHFVVAHAFEEDDPTDRTATH